MLHTHTRTRAFTTTVSRMCIEYVYMFWRRRIHVVYTYSRMCIHVLNLQKVDTHTRILGLRVYFVQGVTGSRIGLRHVAACCSVLQRVAVCWNVKDLCDSRVYFVQSVQDSKLVLQHVAVCCSVLQRVAVCCIGKD